MNNILLRFLSLVFKVLGGGCIVFAFFFAYRVIEPYHTNNSARTYSNFPELYFLILAGAFLIPMAVGIITIGASFFIDVLITQRLIRREIKELKEKPPQINP